MGLNCSWIAVQGLKVEDALASLQMEVSEVLSPDEIPDGLGMAQLPDDWLLSSGAERQAQWRASFRSAPHWAAPSNVK